MFRNLLPNEGTPKTLCLFFERETDKRLIVKVPTNVRLNLSSKCTKMYFETVHYHLIVEETGADHFYPDHI